jgi:hypothetical protein
VRLPLRGHDQLPAPGGGEERGVDVVYRVICWQDAGTFRIEPIRSFPPENVSAPTDYILLEGSRRLDEHQAGG